MFYLHEMLGNRDKYLYVFLSNTSVHKYNYPRGSYTAHPERYSFIGNVTESATSVRGSAIPACAAEPKKENRVLHIVGAYIYRKILVIEHKAPRAVKA